MEKTTEYGQIKISENVFEKMVREGIALSKGRDTLAMERKSIIIEETDDEISVEFHVIHKFGTSIILSSMTVLDYIENNLRSVRLGKKVNVIMRIVGIKARRSIKTDHVIKRTIY